ncbi:SusC/RagA family TonB-linked outer membrane protein [Seonamhaeicola algicola]|uniref:SusC/RagA family TonB-linked outer membrane protein n=1 Tax=Seonamhaeicola algicola TaxID=1719036 RepID=A0A5C7APE4_9FLAO|nr:SusC/RagA family TonB-linked outer membrane protein [Seonamhaeicola algicola]TXE09824.1 SusC/RagA family TonB-linked outer membrane protein [Seonamhaeicola algicola]
MKTKFKGILMLFLAFVVQISFAQDKKISGVVSDESGLPLPGTTVLVKGSTSGTSTDFDGKYTITASQGATLVYSFVGYITKEVTVGASNTINIVMSEDAAALEEVVVVAYGTQKRESITGSVSVIKSDQIENATFSNPVKSLEGLVSGLRVIQANGQPGSDPLIRIRGFGSINADSAPLIVLDGVPYSGSLSSINPQDIESTTVLKDASSTSLYGNKASNGVLLITTKTGKKNRKPKISFDTRYGLTQRATKEYNITESPQEFYEAYHSVLTNSEFYRQNEAGTPITIEQARQFASDNLIDRLGYNLYDVADNVLIDPTTGRLNTSANLLVNDRWEDALFRDNASFSSTNLNISGGSENIDYYFSLGTEENNGYTVRSNFKRHTTRLKVNATNIAEIITLSGDVAYAKSKSQAVPSTVDAAGVPTTNFANAFFWNRRIAPIYPVYQYDENWNHILNPNNPNGYAYDFGQPQNFANGTSRGPRNYAPGEHPLAVIENTEETNDRDNFNAALRAQVDLPFGFKFQYVMNYLTEIDKGTDFTKPGAGAFAEANNGLLTNNRDNFSAFTNQQLLTWNKEFGIHSFDVLLGHETYEENFTTLSLSKRNIIGNFSPILDNTSVYASASNYNTNYTTEGYFSRFIYGLDNTYYANLTARHDASSVFHPDARWGTFWSAGASWIISNEDFLSNSSTINYAKLALNYGTTGNDRIFYEGTTTRNLVAYENQYSIGENNGQLTQTLYSLGSKEITWEKAASLDIAYEMSLFNSLNLSLGYYRKKSEDLLFNNPLQLSTGQASRPENFGSMVNSGFEAEVSWNAVKKEKFNVTFNANVSTLKNEITELPRDSIQSGNFRRVVGRSIYDYFMVQSAGVNADNGNAQYYTTDETTGERIITEDYADAVSNGRTFLDKTAIPDITGGFGTNITLGNFSLGLQFAYQVGGYGIDNEYFGLLGATQNVTNFADYNKTWTVDNPTASLPRVDPLSPDQYRISDMWLVDLSYLSLNNINFGYTLQTEALKKYHIENVRFYGTVNNAFLLYRARQGYDPRLNSVGSSSAEYGANRTIAFGVNINLN